LRHLQLTQNVINNNW